MSLDPTNTEDLARRILLHSRRRISNRAPVLLEAVYALHEEVLPVPLPLSTDTCTLWFHPETVVEDFRKDRDSVARQLLHVTLHCLLGHPGLRKSSPDPRAFDCAADLKAAQLAEGLCGTAFATNHTLGVEPDFERIPHLRPLCEALKEDGGKRLRRDADCVRFDNHALWNPPVPPHGSSRSPKGSGTGQGNGDSRSGGSPSGSGDGQGKTPAPDGSTGHGSGADAPAAPDWDRIRRSMLDGCGGKLPGTCAGMLTESFAVEERGMSFAAFLRRFAAPEERMLLDPDSFDVRWYHLGMEYYGDIPLLEPSEISEPPLPDDIVVALDVSASCHGETCRRFLRELLGILRDISAGAPRFHVCLLLCDTRIQKEILLETPEQVDALFADFTITGFGGTDFRPVFERVEQLRSSGKLPRVRGLLYLTDGCGTYPSHPSDYPTAFLIPAEDEDSLPRGTEWITRLYLNETDFTLKEATV